MALAQRRKAIPVNVGGVVIGGAAPIAVQTMTKTDTRDVKATLRQIHELKEAGCEIVRPAVPDREAAEALKEIVKGSPLPVIADIHYDHKLALLAIEAGRPSLSPQPGDHPTRAARFGAASCRGRGTAARAGLPPRQPIHEEKYGWRPRT